MAIRKAMSKKTDPPAKRGIGVLKTNKPVDSKPKGGSQFLPKGIPAGTSARPVSLEEKVKIARQLYRDNPGKVYSDAVKRAEKNLADSKKK
jgi:hypothetical protein